MGSSPTTTLFTVQVESRSQPMMLAASALIHGALIALISYGILNAPRLSAHSREHYVMRQIDLTSPKLPPPRATKGITYPKTAQTAKSRSRQGAAGRAAAARNAMMVTTHAPRGPQTLLQPDLAAKLALQEKIQIPQMLIWKHSPTVVKKIVAPPPTPPRQALAKPSLELPNQEVTVSDLNLASAPLAQQKLKVLPSTTSPVVIPGVDLATAAPSTVSQIQAQPTPAAVMSLSNLRLEGTAALPPVNESALRATPGALAPSTAKDGTEAGSADNSQQGKAAGSGKISGASGQSTGQSAQGNTERGASGTADRTAHLGQTNGAATGPSQGANTATSQYANTSTTAVSLPKTGAFSSVVVGNTMQDQFPEVADVWKGRMAYTVYLHVGLAHSWILQYSLPAKAALALNGQADHLQAPWPYSIVRPNLPADSVDADALMVHGFVNTAGRFEGLSVVVPQPFAQAQFVLDSLSRWQFRPASANGQSTRVEVLLIIPEDEE